ncbi:MAG TPA: hypothetical protein VGI39_17865 [Polyangiaceae bacterium]|jgi:hypothetical protein
MTNDMIKRVASAVVDSMRDLIEQRLREELGSAIGLSEARPTPVNALFPPGLMTEARRAGRSKPARPVKAKASRGREIDVNAIVKVLQGAPKDGLQSEVLRERLKLPDSARRSLQRALSDAVDAKKVVRRGERRWTFYSLPAK